MCNDIFEADDCTEFCDERAIIVAKDKGNRQEYRASNKKIRHCCKIRIDNCFIKTGEKCDFMILNCTDKTAYLIELKGSDLVKSFRQINVTIDKLLSQLDDFKIYARSVITKAASAGGRKLEENSKRSFGACIPKRELGNEKTYLFSFPSSCLGMHSSKLCFECRWPGNFRHPALVQLLTALRKKN